MSANHGGVRPGAGQKPSCAPQIGASASPEEFLSAVMNDPAVELAKRLNAAELLLRFAGGRSGKKERAVEAGKSGRFATPAPPAKLVVNNA